MSEYMVTIQESYDGAVYDKKPFVLICEEGAIEELVGDLQESLNLEAGLDIYKVSFGPVEKLTWKEVRKQIEERNRKCMIRKEKEALKEQIRSIVRAAQNRCCIWSFDDQAIQNILLRMKTLGVSWKELFITEREFKELLVKGR